MANPRSTCHSSARHASSRRLTLGGQPRAVLRLLAWCAVFALLPTFGCSDPAEPVQPLSVPDAAPAGADREVLVRLYRTTGGERWKNNDGWLATGPLNTWHGVETNSTGRVIRLTLDRNDLAGTLPPELGNLAELQSLDLSYNELTGPVPPEYADLAELRTLRLRNNALTGPVPPVLSRLTALQQLSLAHNRLTGTVPTELADYPDLNHLDLRRNRLQGPIPVELATLASLEALRLAGNRLTGPIPPQLGQLDRLVQILIADNELSGALPPELSVLSELELLSVSDNRLTGTVPSEYLGLAKLRGFNWRNNDGLCAPGLAAYFDWASAMEAGGPWCHVSDVAALDALYSTAGGPSWLSSGGWPKWGPLDARHGVAEIDSLGRVVALDLERNGLRGVVPSAVGRLSALRSLRIGGNSGLRGNLPKSMADLEDLQELSYDGTHLCVPDDPRLRGWLEGVSVHNGTGIRCEQLGDRALLADFFAATNGPSWTRRDSWLTDKPLAEWWGVEVDSAGRVVGLDLSDNGLEGPLLSTLGLLRQLRTLDLSYNELTGPVPPEYADLAELRTLRLRNNALTGPVPPVLSRLTALQQLSLAHNRLTGTVPTELADYPDLNHLDLRRNRLQGPIPVELATLASLEALRLAGNRLTGPIPPQLGQLDRLVQILIADNELSGALPPELSVLSELELLSVSDNRLTGTVPSEYLGLAKLRGFNWRNNDGLCAPGLAAYFDWASAMEAGGPWCHVSDVAALDALYSTAGGPSWLSSGGWPKWGPLDARHGVAEIDSLGRVVALDLERNGLRGVVPSAVGRLSALRSLRIGGNSGLRGNLPKSMADLEDLQELSYDGTHLCVPDDPRLRGWLEGVSVHNGTGIRCEQLGDRALLADFFAATNGPSWTRRDSWLTDKPLAEWWGVEVDGTGRVVGLDLSDNGLEGPLQPTLGLLRQLRTLRLTSNKLRWGIPSELGALSLLQHLDLEHNLLSGPIPPELGNLAELRELLLFANNLTGAIPPELGALSLLQHIDLEHNSLSGPIPPELGNLLELRELLLSANSLTGAIPPELTSLPKLVRLRMYDNELVDSLSVQLLSGSAFLEEMDLAGNRLSGPLHSEVVALSRLKRLRLARNTDLRGSLPEELTALGLEELQVGGTQLCAPRSLDFRAWLNAIPTKYVPLCPPAEDGEGAATLSAYLVQAVQSFSAPVPLIAGREALLRVFATSAQADRSEPYPLVRATFFAGDRTLYALDIAPQESRSMPAEVDENDLASSANAEIPAWVIRPGLEIVVETNPDGAPSARGRLPKAGRMALDVRQVPPLQLTVVPFLLQTAPDSSILEATTGLTADDDLLWQVRTFSPAAAVEVEVHEPVWTPSDDAVAVVLQTEAVRVIEKKGVGHWSGGYWMGMMSVFDVPEGWWGTAIGVGRSSVSSPHGRIMAHELLHNMGSFHAPCHQPRNFAFDYYHPHSDGTIGGVGYDFRRKMLVGSDALDVMGNYARCRPMWVSDYTFLQALSHRLRHEAVGGSAAQAGAGPDGNERPQSMLLWGTIDAHGAPSLNPAFLVDAWPSLPVGGGSHEIVGTDGAGRAVFSIRFDPREVSHGDGSSVFAFTLPVRPEWADALASITLAGPGGASAVLGDAGPSMTLLRDPDTGQVRGILRDRPAAGPSSDRAGRRGWRLGGLMEPSWQVQVSRGVPNPASWRR